MKSSLYVKIFVSTNVIFMMRDITRKKKAHCGRIEVALLVKIIGLVPA